MSGVGARQDLCSATLHLQHKAASWSAHEPRVDIGNEQEGRKGGNRKGQRGGSEGVGGKRMAGAGTDIACPRRVVQSSLNLELSGGVWPESGVRSQHADSVDLQRALRNVRRAGTVHLSWPDRIDWGNVVHAKRAWMERSVVAVVQLNLSLRTGAGSTAQCLRFGLDIGAAATLSRWRVRKLRERMAPGCVNVGQTRRQRDRCHAPASPCPSPCHRAGAALVCNSHAASGQELSRGLALKTMRGQADVTDRERERIASIKQHSVFPVGLRRVVAHRRARPV
ncbi:hypothetical protein B0H14DRAFT_2632375 [Mycena olivaceomarginata]|nr:hypothetical protein B0H14DRAFT_2632375 [Mycena olivaceomarginata]